MKKKLMALLCAAAMTVSLAACGTPPEKPGGGSSGDSFTENGETLTGDCVITSLTNNGTINFNGYTITLAGGTVLQ